MARTVIVDVWDCLINLGRQEGFWWETIWNHPQNSKLRQRRRHPNIIKKGDEVFIPDLTLKEVLRPTDQVHHFVRKGLSTRFSLTIQSMGRPRANEQYTLLVNGRSQEGHTDEHGALTEWIPADARDGLLLLGEDREKLAILFGCVDPIDEISGVKSRLQNLGLYHGEIDDELTPETIGAIAEFQRRTNLSGNGELTDETRQALVEAHKS